MSQFVCLDYDTHDNARTEVRRKLILVPKRVCIYKMKIEYIYILDFLVLDHVVLKMQKIRSKNNELFVVVIEQF